jgi:hypothetical protein
MSTFKLKPGKARQISDINTLDEIHRKHISEFKNRKKQLPKKKIKLSRLDKQLVKLESKSSNEYTTNDVRTRSKLKCDIKNLHDEIYDIENDISEIEYYSKTEDILMDYYDIIEDEDDHLYEENPELSSAKHASEITNLDILDRLNLMNKQKKNVKKVTRRRKKKQNNCNANDIRTFFGCQVEDNNAHVADETSSDNPDNILGINNSAFRGNRATYLENYRMMIDYEYSSEHRKDYNPIRHCHSCFHEKTLIHCDGNYVCENCGEVEMVIVDSERPNYKENVPDKPGYPYKRVNHFNE